MNNKNCHVFLDIYPKPTGTDILNIIKKICTDHNITPGQISISCDSYEIEFCFSIPKTPEDIKHEHDEIIRKQKEKRIADLILLKQLKEKYEN
jgi:hypothetical protein